MPMIRVRRRRVGPGVVPRAITVIPTFCEPLRAVEHAVVSLLYLALPEQCLRFPICGPSRHRLRTHQSTRDVRHSWTGNARLADYDNRRREETHDHEPDPRTNRGTAPRAARTATFPACSCCSDQGRSGREDRARAARPARHRLPSEHLERGAGVARAHHRTGHAEELPPPVRRDADEAADDSGRHRWRRGDEQMIPVRYRQLQIALAAWRRNARDLDLEGCLDVLRLILADFSELLPAPRSPSP